VGILRSMGADRGTILKVFLTEVLFTAMAIFLVALVLSLTLYYSVIMPWTTIESFGVSFAVYNGWTVLILAAVCYFVPFLSAIVPLMLFFKKPIVANISGETKRFRRGRVKVQPMS